MTILSQPTRYLFFTGKGVVGKTSLSAATAIGLADAGKRVLLVSTDAASNLDEMLDVPLRNHPSPFPAHLPCRCLISTRTWLPNTTVGVCWTRWQPGRPRRSATP